MGKCHIMANRRFPVTLSLMDRVYSSHTFVTDLIRKQAQETGIQVTAAVQ